jgi:hypothetical protein
MGGVWRAITWNRSAFDVTGAGAASRSFPRVPVGAASGLGHLSRSGRASAAVSGPGIRKIVGVSGSADTVFRRHSGPRRFLQCQRTMAGVLGAAFRGIRLRSRRLHPAASLGRSGRVFLAPPEYAPVRARMLSSGSSGPQEAGRVFAAGAGPPRIVFDEAPLAGDLCIQASSSGITGQVLIEIGGGPVATRTPDLYRVKVAL